MREADRRCIEVIGIPGVVLMNNAGAAVFNEIDRNRVVVVCGKGNNGGDGYVVARLALLAGHPTSLVHIGDPAEMRGDGAVFRDVALNLGFTIDALHGEAAVVDYISRPLTDAILIDALLGTGISGEVRGDIRTAIECWPKVPTISVDVPSGLNADTGEVCGACIRADTTVTFQYPKLGFLNESAMPYLGRLVVADIGIPEICCDDGLWRDFLQNR